MWTAEVQMKWRCGHRDCNRNLTCSKSMGFIAQLVEHCSANAEATGSNPVEALENLFSGSIHNCLNWNYNCDGHIFISFDRSWTVDWQFLKSHYKSGDSKTFFAKFIIGQCWVNILSDVFLYTFYEQRFRWNQLEVWWLFSPCFWRISLDKVRMKTFLCLKSLKVMHVARQQYFNCEM